MTQEIKSKGRKSFLNYNLVISEIFNLLRRRDMASMISKLSNSENIKGQRVSWNIIEAVLQKKRCKKI